MYMSYCIYNLVVITDDQFIRRASEGLISHIYQALVT
jgi:hypothetical protein